MVVTNHPLASAAGTEMLLAGGNAVDAAIASLFALTVVEPMMVGILGGGLSHIRTADGTHVIVDGLSTAPRLAHAVMFDPLSDEIGRSRDVRDKANLLGPMAVAVPGALAAWCETLARFGTMPLADVIAPAIRYAKHGFVVSPYLTDCIADCRTELSRDAGLARMFLPGGEALKPGSRLVQGDYANTLALIARSGSDAFYAGSLGGAFIEQLKSGGGIVSALDLTGYRTRLRQPLRGTYRGFGIVGPPPPASSGVHIVQMLNILEHFSIRELGFATADGLHLLAEVLKIAFADRALATADPDFVDVPVHRLTSKTYAAERRLGIDLHRAAPSATGRAEVESANTTHVTVADAAGNVVASTQTINGLFGAFVQIAGTGMLANNYMFNFDPHPGRALSIAPNKRVFTSMAPMMVTSDGQVLFALGLPGGLRIFPSALQAIVNLIDHRMDLQSAVEAPRIFCEGGALEIEEGIDAAIARELSLRGHTVERLPRIGGGMNAVGFNPNKTLTGAACWRADGTPVAFAGGFARPGVRFSLS